MKQRAARESREETLKRLVYDARAEAPTELDWSELERRLMSEVARTPRERPRSLHPFLGLAFAAAAGLVLFFIAQRGRAPVPQVSPRMVEATLERNENGDALAPSSRVTADRREVSVEHAGRALWTLAPHSAAILAERDTRIRLLLERGSVLSQVVPSPRPETFVVEAAQARVAVHGTVFRVSLEGERVVVDVREGTVAVGARGAAPAFFLRAPAHGDFAADGRSGSIDGRPVGATSERRPEPVRGAPSKVSSAAPAASTSPPAPSAELPLEPSINDIETGISQIVETTTDCFSRLTQSADGVQIMVRTALSLQISDTGAVSNVDFQPPLSPEVEECAAAGIAQVSFAPSKQGTQVTRLLELKR